MYAALIIPISEARRMRVWEIATNGKKMEEIRIAVKVASGDIYDNNHFYLRSIHGKLYAFSLHQEHNQITWNLWDHTGCCRLGSGNYGIDPTHTLPSSVWDEIEERISKYEEGFLRCSDCNSLFTVGNCGGSYFAGRYCSSCWMGATGKYKDKGGWHTVAARETYE